LSYVITDYNSSGQPLDSTKYYDNGTHSQEAWDTLGQYSWSYVRDEYNASNQLLMADYNNDNGGRTVDYWDVLNQRSWGVESINYDGYGRLMNASFSNDNGGSSQVLADPNNQYLWGLVTINYDGYGRSMDERVTNDNATYSLYFWDFAAQHNWNVVAENFNQFGQDTSNITYYDDGHTNNATPGDFSSYGDPTGFSDPGWTPVSDPGDGEGFLGGMGGAAAGAAQNQVLQLVSAMAGFAPSGGAVSEAGLASTAVDGAHAGALIAPSATQSPFLRAA
jgi:hypothetical protein